MAGTLEPIELARIKGNHDGHDAAVDFLFSGAVDNDAIIIISNNLRDGQQATIDLLPKPNHGGTKPYPPNQIAIAYCVSDSPWSWYLDICDAYDNSFQYAVVEHIHQVAGAVRAGLT